MAKCTNAEVEKSIFEKFSKAYQPPHGRIEYGDKPDVRIIGERTIGIEITRFYHEPGDSLKSEQQQRRLRDCLVTNAQTEYLRACGRNIELTLSFNPNHPIALSHKKALIETLVKFVRSIETQASGPISRHLFQSIMPEISDIYLNSREYGDAKWRIAQPYEGRLMSEKRLEKIVSVKEEKVPGYARCDAYWLLVAVDWIDPAQDQEIRVEGVKIPSKIFERIIVYKPKFNHIVEAPLCADNMP